MIPRVVGACNLSIPWVLQVVEPQRVVGMEKFCDVFHWLRHFDRRRRSRRQQSEVTRFAGPDESRD
jgi:hypothetical protein